MLKKLVILFLLVFPNIAVAGDDDPVVKILVWGTCVTRDSVEFMDNGKACKYVARQSIISFISKSPLPKILKKFKFNEGNCNFHKRVILEDLNKSSFEKLRIIDQTLPIIIDLIDERFNIGVTECGAYVTMSGPALRETNLKSLVVKEIQAYSDKHIELFTKHVTEFAERISELGGQIIIHRAFHAEGKWNVERANTVLNHFYDLLVKNFENPLIVEVDKKFRISSPFHKWGESSLHYTDVYYIEFVSKLSETAGLKIEIDEDATVQKSEVAETKED